MRSTIAVLLITAASGLFAATGDVNLSPTLLAPLPGLAHVKVATSGMEYLVVYARGQEIWWQRIAIDGTPLDPYARRLEGAKLEQGFQDWIEVVWTGEAYLLVWNEKNNAVIAQAIDHDGIVTERLPIVSGMTLRDAAAWQTEVAVLTSAGSSWRLTLLNPYGAVLGVQNFVADPSAVLQIVRLAEGWALVAPGTDSGVVIINPQTGASRRAATDRRIEDVHASPAGGALLIGTDASVGVLRPNGEFVPLSLAVERLSIFHAALVSPAPSGWAVIYRTGGTARIAIVRTDGTLLSDAPLSGPFPSPDSLRYYGFAAASARDDSHLLLQPAPVGTAVGLESIAVSGTRAYVTATYAISDAVQEWARTAYGPGIDFVVWLEAGFQGWDIRATRVQDGAPLDGEGIVLGAGFPASLETVYDGEAFSVVWSDQSGIFLRRVDLLGHVLDDAPLKLATNAAQKVTVAGSGDGGLLVGWPEPQPTVAYVRTARVRIVAPVGSGETGRQLEAGGSRTAYLVAFAQPSIGCRFDPCLEDEKRVAVQLVNADGTPTGSPVPITPPTDAIVGRPFAHASDWFVPVLRNEGPRLVRVSPFATSVIGSVPTILAGRPFDGAGGFRSAPGGIEVTGARFRGLLTSDPQNVWYEPLPLASGESSEGSMAQSETLLVDTGTRYVLRPLAAVAESADIALVRAGGGQGGLDTLDTVRIEHRGGDDVSALHVEIWPATLNVTSSRPIVGGRIEGPFKAGETIELKIQRPTFSEPLVTVLPFAREIAAADNFLLLAEGEEPPPPTSPRRRLVAR